MTGVLKMENCSIYSLRYEIKRKIEDEVRDESHKIGSFIEEDIK